MSSGVHTSSGYCPPILPDHFLGLPAESADYTRAQVLVLPIPFEATTCYGQGTVQGPAAIIEASRQVEFYDREFGCEPALIYGIHTLPEPPLPPDPEGAIEAIAEAVASAALTGKLVVGLGGEHTVSIGFGRGLLRALGGPLTVVQIDAHCDLRAEYGNSAYSHACTARRLFEEPGVEQILQLGIRLEDVSEVEFARSHCDRIGIWHIEEVRERAWQAELAARLHGRRVFLTIDVDGLDPSIVPSTGAPVPDGLTWHETIDIIRTVARSAQIVGLDCVELAPIRGLIAADYTVAVLLYKAISYVMMKGSIE